VIENAFNARHSAAPLPLALGSDLYQYVQDKLAVSFFIL